MYTAKIQNKNGNILVLTQKEQVYQLQSIEGLNPPHGTVNTTVIVGMDGALYNSAKLETREIVITLKINGDAEQNRLALYSYFRTKEWCRFFYTNESRNVYIDGYVTNVECSLFEQEEIAQITILCPAPYFSDLTEIVDDISSTVSLFTFPFSINQDGPIPISELIENREANVINSSETEVGITIEATFFSAAQSVEIRNATTGEDITVEYRFQNLDVLKIITVKGKKSLRLMRDGSEINLFPALKKGSVLFQLQVGSNILESACDGDVNIKLYHSNLYRGV